MADTTPGAPPVPQVRRPLGLLAELTYRCPLRCAYCSNPVALEAYAEELTCEQWCRVLDEARQLGVLQVHLSGGEPLARQDIAEVVRHAHALGLYTTLVTGGQALTPARVESLVRAGLDHVQISLQDAEAGSADSIAGKPVHRRKLAAAKLVKERGLPLSLNVVLHRGNIGRVGELIALAAELGADRLELANAQFYGWALLNRTHLLPNRDQLAAVETLVRAARERLHGTVDIVYVVSDYHEDWPKPCMHGWGSRQLTVAPNGDVLPCPAAAQIPGLAIPNVRETPLADIWFDSTAFNRFRGTEWMTEPCRSCPRKQIDHGGCRCQAYQLTGDPAATDPVCRLSPHHTRILRIAQEANARPTASSRTRPIPRQVPRH